MNTPIYEPLKPAFSSAKRFHGDSTDAIALLMADHRRVERHFLEFQMTTSMRREEELAMQICDAIRIHADLDEQIFYPAYLQATRDRYHYQFALAQHAQIKALIDEIEKLALTEESVFAKLHLLCELFDSTCAWKRRPAASSPAPKNRRWTSKRSAQHGSCGRPKIRSFIDRHSTPDALRAYRFAARRARCPNVLRYRCVHLQKRGYFRLDASFDAVRRAPPQARSCMRRA